MYTGLDEYNDLGDFTLPQWVSAKNFKKIKKATNDAFKNFIEFFAKFIRAIFKKKIV